MSLLEVADLTVRIGGEVVLEDIGFTMGAGDRLGLIGESGSGKSMTALAILGLLPEGAEVTGSVRFDGVELLHRSDREMSRLRGGRISMVFQEPLSALNPLMRVGKQIAEPLRLHQGLSRKHARAEAISLMEKVGLPDPEHLARAYPHQLSGGQCQRVGIAMALASRPALLLADEPTTALDVTVQAEILSLLDDLVDEQGTALLFVTHDLAVLARVAHRVVVLRAGRTVEQGSLDHILHTPEHPYTQTLLALARSTAFRPAVNNDAPANPHATGNRAATRAPTDISIAANFDPAASPETAIANPVDAAPNATANQASAVNHDVAADHVATDANAAASSETVANPTAAVNSDVTTSDAVANAADSDSAADAKPGFDVNAATDYAAAGPSAAVDADAANIAVAVGPDVVVNARAGSNLAAGVNSDSDAGGGGR